MGGAETSADLSMRLFLFIRERLGEVSGVSRPTRNDIKKTSGTKGSVAEK